MKQKKQICIDCDKKTDNYYSVSTNKGNIYKCRDCYELWITRTTREMIESHTPHINKNKIIDADRQIS